MVRRIYPIIQSGSRAREGKGFSKPELDAAEISPGEARRLGIPFDSRRSSFYDDNVETLKLYIGEAREAKVKFSKPKQTGKPHKRRVYRGLTSAGKKMRNLSRRK
jgi:large subunit ribosomal protein L13e